MRNASHPWKLLLMSAALGLWSGCSLALDFTECTSDETCQALQTPGERLICGPDQRCIEDPSLKVIEPCQEHHHCLVDGATPRLCHFSSQRCVAIDTERCPTLLLPSAGLPAGSAVLGAVVDVGPAFSANANGALNALRLAHDEFSRNAALPGGARAGVVVCSSTGSLESTRQAANHLVVELGLPALLTALTSSHILAITGELALPRERLFVSPWAHAAALAAYDDSALLWRLTTSDLYHAAALADRIAARAPTRVVAFAKDDLYGEALHSAITAALPELSWHSVAYPAPDAYPDAGQRRQAYQSRVDDAMSALANADLVLFLGTTEAVELMLMVDQALQSAGTATPFYLFSHGALPALPEAIRQSRDANLARVEAVGPLVANGDAHAAFAQRFRDRFGGDPPAGGGLVYDATTTLLLALCALPTARSATGLTLSHTLPRLADPNAGLPLSVATGDFAARACTHLAGEGSIALTGATASLDFAANGHLRDDLGAYQIEKRSGDYFLRAVQRFVLSPGPQPGGTWQAL